MQFIKPSYVQQLLKLKTPEDIERWREDRRANFPTKSKRELINSEKLSRHNENGLNVNDFNQFEYNKFNNNKYNHHHNKFNKNKSNDRFNKNNKFNKQNKRPFQKKNQQSNEPKEKKFKSNQEQESKEATSNSKLIDNLNVTNESSSTNLENQSTDQKNKPGHFKRKRQPTLLEKVNFGFY